MKIVDRRGYFSTRKELNLFAKQNKIKNFGVGFKKLKGFYLEVR